MARSIIIARLHIGVCVCVSIFFGLVAKLCPSPLRPHGL